MYKSLYFGTFPNLSTGIIYAFNMYAKTNGAFSCSFIDTYILYCGVYYMLGFKMILAFWIMFQAHWSVKSFLVMGNKRWHFLLYISIQNIWTWDHFISTPFNLTTNLLAVFIGWIFPNAFHSKAFTWMTTNGFVMVIATS